MNGDMRAFLQLKRKCHATLGLLIEDGKWISKFTRPRLLNILSATNKNGPSPTVVAFIPCLTANPYPFFPLFTLGTGMSLLPQHIKERNEFLLSEWQNR